MMTFAYPVDLAEDDTGLFTAVMPDVRSAHTEGETRAEALAHAADALESALSIYIDNGEDLPAPSPARGRPLVCPSAGGALKLHIYQAMRDQKIRKAELARRMQVKPMAIHRLLDLCHNSTTDQLEAALKALGLRVRITADAA